MINQRIGKIKVRRGTDSQRVSNTFEEGEVVYSVDKKRIFVGDDVTLGGVPVSNRNYIVESLGNPPTLPLDVLGGDIIFDKSEEKTYITNLNGTEYELLLIGDFNCCRRLKNQIDDLYTKLRTMTGCLDEPPKPPPPPSKLSWAIQPLDNYVNIGDTVTFTASAVGNGNISYVWRRVDNLTINASNIYKNAITIPNVSIPDIAIYYCVASNAVDSITSTNVALDIETNSILAEDGTRIMSEINEFILWEANLVGLTITKQPVSVSTTAGTSVTFSVEAMGSSPITYQWRIAGVDVVGETKSTYTITNPTVDINSISCKVSNPAGDVFSNSANLTIIKNINFIKDVQTGYYFTLALTLNGDVYGWGDNGVNQFGDVGGSSRYITYPIKLNVSNVEKIRANEYSSFFIGKDGSLSACGSFGIESQGPMTSFNIRTITKVNLPPVSDIITGRYTIDGNQGTYTITLGVDGTLSAWGSNYYGSLGDGTKVDKIGSRVVKLNLPPISSISSGGGSTIAIGVDGNLYGWGVNQNGQLGNIPTSNKSVLTPTKLNFISESIKMIDTDYWNTLIVSNNGSVSGFGYVRGLFGGVGSSSESSKLINLPPVSDVSIGNFYHAFAVGINNELSASGSNTYGQLGDGTTNAIKLKKINLPPVKKVAASPSFTMFLGVDGTLSACGNNGNGQLGNGTRSNTNYLTPVLVKF